MPIFKAREFAGLPYDVPPGVSYEEILSEALSEQERVGRIGESLRYAALCYSIANASRRLGRFELVENNYNTALSIYRCAGNACGAAWTYWSIGNYRQQEGQHASAINSLRKAYLLACANHDANCARYSLAGIAEIARIQGNYSHALIQHIKVREMFLAIEDMRGVIWADEGIAQMFLRQGRVGQARRLFYRALLNAMAIGDGRGIAWARRGLAEGNLRLGQFYNAIELANLAQEGFRRTGVRIGEGYACLTNVRALHGLGDRLGADEALLAASVHFRTCKHPRGLRFVDDERRFLDVR